MSFDFLQEKYPDFYLFHFETLGLYHAINDNDIEYLLNPIGEVIYTKPKNDNVLVYTNFTFLNWSRKGLEFNKYIEFWIEHTAFKNLSTCKIFTYKNQVVQQLLNEQTILSAEPIGPRKVLLQTAIDKNNPNELTQIYIFDFDQNHLQKVTTTRFVSTPHQTSPLVVHQISGTAYLFSVLIDIKKEDEYLDHKIYRMYKNNGEQLLPFDTTIGQNGEETWFEQKKPNMGITYRLLDEPINFSSSWYNSEYWACNSLIDIEGNFYGDFYYISGQVPSELGKTSTKHPKYVDKNLLCLSLPQPGGNVPLLTIVTENNQLIHTKYECPWLFFSYSQAVIKDKKLFGKTALVVLDQDKFVRLIDLQGQEIENVVPIKCETLFINYKKLFIEQASL